jgi:hypothetical protein
MNILELQSKLDRDRSTESTNAAAVIAFVRPLVSMLRDLGREHTAADLERILFVYDAAQQDASDWLKANRELIVSAMLDAFQKRPPL